MDATAALRCYGIDVELVGEFFEIPPRPAADWLEACWENAALAIVPGLFTEEDEAAALDLMAEVDIPLDDILQAARDALEAATGRPWWQAEYLIYGAEHSWAWIGGEFTTGGMDLTRCSIGAFCNAVYALALRGMDKEKRERFDFELSTPPPDAVDESATDEALGDMFLAAFQEAKRQG